MWGLSECSRLKCWANGSIWLICSRSIFESSWTSCWNKANNKMFFHNTISILLFSVLVISKEISWQRPGCHKVGEYSRILINSQINLMQISWNNRTQPKNRDPRLCWVLDKHKRLPRILWILRRSIGAVLDFFQQVPEASHIGRTML